MARISGIAFVAVVVLALSYTVSRADAVFAPIIEAQQEALRGFLSDARNATTLWAEAAESLPEVLQEPRDPEPGDDFLERRLPEVTVTEEGPYQFLKSEPFDDPLRFDPCRPVYWSVNPENEPDVGRALTQAAFDTISQHTGLEFQYVGETSENWASNRDIRNEFYEGVGDWKPVVVWWLEDPQVAAAYTLAAPNEEPRSIAGFAGPHIMSYGAQYDRVVSVSGQIVMNATVVRDYLAWGLPDQITRTLLHEIGHLVGLDHVEEDGHVMQPGGEAGPRMLGPGDLQGLALAGAGPCLGESFPVKEDYRPYNTTPSFVFVDDEHGHVH